MFHEVLAALSGYPGSFFKYSDDQSTFKVLKGLEFLHPGEEVLLDRLCQLGAHFKALQEFAGLFFSNKVDEVPQGIYIRAFKNGVNETLQPYQADLMQLQLDVLKDPHITLTHFLQLEQYLPLFRHLIEIIEVIKKDKVHGCKILEIVNNASNCGVPMVEISMKRILRNCHYILMKQTRDWVIFGTLEDPFEEFFIIHDAGVQNSKKGKYILRHEMIPSYIPISTVEKILFVGLSMEVLGADRYASFLTARNSSDFGKREGEFTEKLLDLASNEEFSLFQFASVITELRTCVAEQMWKVIVKDSSLLTHLQNVRDFYLLGNGEFFLAFIEKANKFLKLPIAETTLKETQTAFQSALLLSSDVENFVEKFHIVLQEENIDGVSTDAHLSKTNEKKTWSSISLVYDVPSSLETVFTSNLMDRYNQLFRFLVAIRRVQMELYQCFVLQKCNRKLKQNSPLIQYWQLRTHMSFFIDNLLYYLQVDIIESQFQELIKGIEGVKDFELIQHAHEQFLTSLASQCFLNLKSVYYCLMDILELVSSFCALLTRVHVAIGESEMAHYSNFRLNFQRQTSLLFRVLCGIRSHQDSPHLSQLMLRMDFNRYVTTCGGHLGG